MATTRILPSKSPPTRAIYQNMETVQAILGPRGRPVLRKILDLITNAATDGNWPLVQIEVAPVEDMEVENWRYVLMILVLNCDFEAADGYLRSLYERLDSLVQVLDSRERDILQRKLFFDVSASV